MLITERTVSHKAVLFFLEFFKKKQLKPGHPLTKQKVRSIQHNIQKVLKAEKNKTFNSRHSVKSKMQKKVVLHLRWLQPWKKTCRYKLRGIQVNERKNVSKWDSMCSIWKLFRQISTKTQQYQKKQYGYRRQILHTHFVRGSFPRKNKYAQQFCIDSHKQEWILQI